MASLVRGIPRRDTCTYGPLVVGAEPSVESVRIWGRLADAHTPITKSGSRMPSSGVAWPSFWRLAMGTLSTIACVLKPATASRALSELLALGPNVWRTPPRSKMPPRSTKNGSSRGPAKTVSPVPAVITAD